jgi:hypothetical protein
MVIRAPLVRLSELHLRARRLDLGYVRRIELLAAVEAEARSGLAQGGLGLLDGRLRLLDAQARVAVVESREDGSLRNEAAGVDRRRDDLTGRLGSHVRALERSQRSARLQVDRQLALDRGHGRNWYGRRWRRSARGASRRRRARTRFADEQEVDDEHEDEADGRAEQHAAGTARVTRFGHYGREHVLVLVDLRFLERISQAHERSSSGSSDPLVFRSPSRAMRTNVSTASSSPTARRLQLKRFF